MKGMNNICSINQKWVREPAPDSRAHPITGSITDGIIFGLATYIVLSLIEDWMRRFKKQTK
jgi:xanthine/uracil/vitamin C permease (AzgA family)